MFPSFPHIFIYLLAAHPYPSPWISFPLNLFLNNLQMEPKCVFLVWRALNRMVNDRRWGKGVNPARARDLSDLAGTHGTLGEGVSRSPLGTAAIPTSPH